MHALDKISIFQYSAVIMPNFRLSFWGTKNDYFKLSIFVHVPGSLNFKSHLYSFLKIIFEMR